MASHDFGFADALRGPAALSVVAAHFLGAAYAPGSLVTSLLGQLGVGVFFLVSGFVIPISLTKYGTGAFLVARVLRIYPTYAVALTITLLAMRAASQPLGHGVILYLSNYLIATLSFNQLSFVSVVWTLETELHFYLICALIAPLIREFRIEVLAAPVVIFLAAVWAGYSGFPLAMRLSGEAQFLLFMFGGMAAFYYVNRKISAVAMIFYCVGCCCLLAFAWWNGVIRTSAHLAPSYAAAVMIFLGALFWGARMRGGFFSRISYSLYVIHYGLGLFVINWLVGHSFPLYAAVLGGGVVAVSVAVIVHFAVEAPTHRLGQRLASSLTGRRSAGINVATSEPTLKEPPLRGEGRCAVAAQSDLHDPKAAAVK
jgi:peptidoglycan/LPS O-acetylase OafA/YrhL